jgi:cyclopropane-fatty-acyl-phospholipid synthase
MASSRSEAIVRDLLSFADVDVNGKQPWDLLVHDPRFYPRLLHDVHLGLGESYMDGWWDCVAIDQFIDRVLRADLEQKLKGDLKILFHALKARLFNLQASPRAFQVGERHYDLGNDLFRAMLDKRLNYTCAYWKDSKNLDEAQEAKLDLVCRKTGLGPGMRILELGCGWGCFAKYAAEKYGVQVLGVTVAREQVELGMELCKGLPVELRLQDYREVEGSYDAVISIGIMEHVGSKNYRTYMEVVDRCLKEGGIAFIHSIGGNKSETSSNAWTTRYIFPNGMIPSIAQLGSAMERRFVIEDLHNFGPYYDRTLLAWNSNFQASWEGLKSRYGERFRRMWEYYLLSSAGSFRSRRLQLWQIVMTRPGTPKPDCRFN